MLDKQSFQDRRPDEDVGAVLTPAYFYEILKRRAFYFVIPFLLISTIGSAITFVWPARYISEGTILVSSQEIPTDLVRPTVAALANDRIQIIQQRIMTRDTILPLIKKYQLSTGWADRISGTELVDFIRERTKISSAELTIKSEGRNEKRQAIAFKVGFDYEQPQIAMRVANEIVTMILNEDVQTRTNFAAQTSKFIETEAKRLEAELGQVNNQISELRRARVGTLTDTSYIQDAKELTALRGELLLKSASFSDEHPDIKTLKRKIEALENRSVQKLETQSAKKGGVPEKTTGSAVTTGPAIETLETQRDGLREELNKTTQKLSAARLGESMERGQHSERLEVIEQPTMPQKPSSPNKPRIFAFVFVFALMAGGGLMVGAEMLNQSIHRSTDLYSIFDSQLIVSLPYISTEGEARRKKKMLIITTGILIVVAIGALTALFYLLPPFDVLFERVMSVLGR